MAWMQSTLETNLQLAVSAIQQADALLIGAGAGMGVDSGLPDFRGDAGFWNAYPSLYGRPFHEVANPRWFQNNPAFAWGFYGHRLNLYRQTVPHEGFQILRRWAEKMPAGYFVYTSNVDGQFQKAGFATDRILECHGSIHHLQCSQPCSSTILSAEPTVLYIDEATLQATGELPRCSTCNAIARPNILMFGDGQWLETRAAEQHERYQTWRNQIQGLRVVAIELGAGTAIPTVRFECESLGSRLIRINPREAQTPSGISLGLGAGEALRRLQDLITRG